MSFEALTANDVYESDISKRIRDLQGYRLSEDLSDQYHSVYHNPETRKSHIAIRGTNKTDLGDLHTDLVLSVGNETSTPRYFASEIKLKQVKNKYGKNLSLSGHSLGGQIVANLTANHNVEGHAFNPGSTIMHTAKNAIKCNVFNARQCRNQRKNLTVHTVEGDPLSHGWFYSTRAASKRHIKYKRRGGALENHSMDNFIP